MVKMQDIGQSATKNLFIDYGSETIHKWVEVSHLSLRYSPAYIEIYKMHWSLTVLRQMSWVPTAGRCHSPKSNYGMKTLQDLDYFTVWGCKVIYNLLVLIHNVSMRDY